MRPKITAATLKRDRERRYREREKIADAFEEAAKILDDEPSVPTHVVTHLRDEAKMWRRLSEAS